MATEQTSAQLPELYHNNSAVQRYNNSELLKLFSIPPNAKVLDLGCGTGLLTVSLSELVGPNGQVVAVDPDAQRIEFAKKENTRPNIEYLVGDDQSFPGEDYDFIILANVIQWIKDKRALFENVHKKLAKNGKLAFVTLNGRKGLQFGPAKRKAFVELFSPDFEENVVFKTIQFEDESAYRELAKSFEFEVCLTKTITKEERGTDLETFIAFWARALPGGIEYTSAINPESKKHYKETSEEALKAEPLIRNILVMVLRKC